MHIHRISGDGGWRGGPWVQGLLSVLRIWPLFAEKNTTKPAVDLDHPPNTVKV